MDILIDDEPNEECNEHNEVQPAEEAGDWAEESEEEFDFRPLAASSILPRVQMGSFQVFPYASHIRSEEDEVVSYNEEGPAEDEILDISNDLEKYV